MASTRSLGGWLLTAVLWPEPGAFSADEMTRWITEDETDMRRLQEREDGRLERV